MNSIPAPQPVASSAAQPAANDGAQLVRHLTLVRARALPQRPPDRRWLIERLWADSGVGIIGGEPKAAKTSLALDMAVSTPKPTGWAWRWR